MVLVGIAIAAGAGFLFWLFMRSRNQLAPTPYTGGTGVGGITNPGSLASVAANATLGIGAASFKYGLKGATMVADGALSLGTDAVNASANLLSKTVNLGGTVVARAGDVSSTIVTAGGQVIQAGVGLPVKVVTTQVKVAEAVGGQVLSGAATVTKDLGGAVSSVGKKVFGGVASFF